MIFKNQPVSLLVTQLEHWASRTPDTVAIAFGEQKITFSELKSRVDATRHQLVERYRVHEGDRVAWLGLNHPDMLVLLFACAGMGAIFNPLNSRLARDEYNFLLADGRPRVCFFDTHFAGMIDALEFGKCEPAANTSLEKSSGTFSNAAAPQRKDRALLLVYTSGTTGQPRGVVLSHEAVEANMENCQHLYCFAPEQRVQVTLPLFHVGGLCILLLPALTRGATVYLHQRFDPVATLAEIQRDRITTSIFVPAQMAAMMAVPQWTTSDLSSLSHVAVGSSIIPIQQIKNFHARGIPVSQVYGATETGPAAIALEVLDSMKKEGSAGTPVKLCKIEVRKKDGSVCKNGEIGEIRVSGPNLLSSYWGNLKETARVLVDGWYNTGDIGYRDEEGFYWIIDRLKDVIISGGENIYPAEVEAVLVQHPAIEAIAIIGRPDDMWGEIPVAAVEFSPGKSLSLVEMNAYLEDRIARYKRPKDLIEFDPLPRNAMGKIEKPVLRELLKGRA